jgi:hypothetical protein
MKFGRRLFVILSLIICFSLGTHHASAQTRTAADNLTEPQVLSLINACSGQSYPDVKSALNQMLSSCGPKTVAPSTISCEHSLIMGDRSAVQTNTCTIKVASDNSTRVIDSLYVPTTPVINNRAVNVTDRNSNGSTTGTSNNVTGATGNLTGQRV